MTCRNYLTCRILKGVFKLFSCCFASSRNAICTFCYHKHIDDQCCKIGALHLSNRNAACVASAKGIDIIVRAVLGTS